MLFLIYFKVVAFILFALKGKMSSLAGGQVYVVYRRKEDGGEGGATKREVSIRLGNDIFRGELGLTADEISLRDAVKVMCYIHAFRHTVPFSCKVKGLSASSNFSRVLSEIGHATSFLRSEIARVEDKITELSSHFLGAWISDEGDDHSYFELQTTGSAYLNDVELAFSKIFIGQLLLNIIYVGGTYYCTMDEATESEQPLIDLTFPDIGKRGAGFQLETYDEHPIFRKLSVWQVIPPSLGGSASTIRKSALEAKEDDEAKQIDDLTWMQWIEANYEEDEFEPLDESVLPGGANESFHGGYVQTYCVLKSQDGTPTRRALFRYGEWCYAGTIELEDQVKLADVPHVLRCFQKQQGNLAYMCTIRNLPKNLPWSNPMRHLSGATAFLEKAISGSERELTLMNEHQIAKGIPAWIDEESGCQYFELVTSGDQPHYEEVELLACKTYFNEVVLISLYFGGSFYVTLSPSIDDQPLLDMSFPDVSTKCRGLQLATYRHREFKKLMLWQSTRSVWEAANRAVLEDRARKAAKARAEAEAARALTEESKEDGGHGTSGEGNENPRADSKHNSNADRSTVGAAESKQARNPVQKNITAASGTVGQVQCARGRSRNREAKEAPRRAEKRQVVEKGRPAEKSQPKPLNPLSRKPLGMKSQGSSVRAPHHLKPLGGARGGGLASLNASLPQSDAPWDAQGRPKSLYGGLKPLGSIGSKK